MIPSVQSHFQSQPGGYLLAQNDALPRWGSACWGSGAMVCGAPCAQGCCRAAGGWQPGFGSGGLSHLIRISLTAWTDTNTTDSAESTPQL